MHFRANLKKFQRVRHFIVKNLVIKNICDVAELHTNLRNPL